jgi:hypothetical protein
VNLSHGSFDTLTISTGAITLDGSVAGIHKLTLTASVTTVNHTNLTSSDANFFTLRIAQDGTGGRTFTPPSSWKFPASVAYSASTAANAVDLLNGITYDNGTTWLVTYQKAFG